MSSSSSSQALLASWTDFARATKASFKSSLAFDAQACLAAAQATNPETVQRACAKWAKQDALLLDVQQLSGNNLREMLYSLSSHLAPFRAVCRLVDKLFPATIAAAGRVYSCEKELILAYEDRFCTPELLDQLAAWARTDILIQDELASDRLDIAQILLHDLNWIKQVETCFVEACYACIRVHVLEECAMKITEEGVLEEMLTWCRTVIKPWFGTMLTHHAQTNSLARIDFYLYQQFGALRSREIFELITTFPDSSCAVDDLKTCLLHTQQSKELVNFCKEALNKRLLHVGTNTNLILLVYVRLIKTMMRLDARGILLDACSQQIKQYLRSRPETIKCIVQALTNEVNKNSDLAEELGLMDGSGGGGGALIMNFDDMGEFASDLEGGEEQLVCAPKRHTLWDRAPAPHRIKPSAWEPDPIEAKSSISQLRSSVDVLGNLVRVYGSKELFVSEYRQATAERLLKAAVIDLDAEISRLEMLKLRFGETLLLPVDVMVRDIADSKRANLAIAHPIVESLVLSRLYWPQFASMNSSSSNNNAGDEFALHPRAKVALAEFSHKYAVLKKPRRVQWFPSFGVVDLELTFEDGSTLALEGLSTLQSNIILHFQDCPAWALADLAGALGRMDPDLLRKRLHFWVGEGVIVETHKDFFEISKRAPVRGGHQHGEDGFDSDGEDEEEDDEDVEEEMEGEEELGFDQEEVDGSHFAFVSTMLTNLGALDLETIHKNLQLFSAALPMGYDRDEDDLQQFLDSFVAKGTLDFAAGKFQPPPQ